MFTNNFRWGCATAGYQVESVRARFDPNHPGGSADWDAFVNSAAIRNRVRTLQLILQQGVDVSYEQPAEAVSHDDLNVLRVELDRLVALGLNTYRFSIEWNRVQPNDPRSATASYNQSAFDYYIDGVLAALVQREMTPVISLNHLSLPVWVLTPPVDTYLLNPFGQLPVPADDAAWRSSLGGWESDATVDAFVVFVGAFAGAVKRRFPGLRPIWLTLNEPIGSTVGLGYLVGLWCPGFCGDGNRGKRVCEHLVKAHVRAYQTLKAIDASWQVGFAHAMLHAVPSSTDTSIISTASVAVSAGVSLGGGGSVGAMSVAGSLLGDALLGPLGAILGAIAGAIAGALVDGAVGALGGAVAAALFPTGIANAIVAGQHLHQAAADQFDHYNNEWMLRALVHGEIDPDMTAGKTRTPAEWDLEWTRVVGGAPPRGKYLDFLGINYYRRVHVFYSVGGLAVSYVGGTFKNNMEDNPDPHGVLNDLGWEVFPEGLSTLLRRVKRDHDIPILITENGTAEALDANRAASLVAHVDEIRKATEDADPPDVMGYIHWSNVDNWEWHEDYHPNARFGLHTVGDQNDPANTITIGSGPNARTTFRRQLTEAGLALRYLIRSPTATDARARFGAVSPGGERIDLPNFTNGAIWQGQLGATFVKLFLDTSATGALVGLIYYEDANLWLSLGGLAWDTNARRLSFTHGGRTLPVVRGMSASLVLDSSNDHLTGQSTDSASGTTTPFTLRRSRVHGLWLPTAAGGSWTALAGHQLFDGDPVIKVLLRGDGHRWLPFRATGTASPTVSGHPEVFPGIRFGLAFGADPRDLTISVVGGSLGQAPRRPHRGPTVPTFRRVRSSLTILAEV